MRRSTLRLCAPLHSHCLPHPTPTPPPLSTHNQAVHTSTHRLRHRCIHTSSTSSRPCRSLQRSRSSTFSSARRNYGLFDSGNDDDDGARQFAQKKILRHSPEQVYDVVSAVENYHLFVPWCQQSLVNHRSQAQSGGKVKFKSACELSVGFGPFSEQYRANVSSTPHSKVVSIAEKCSLFDYLDTVWKFKPVESSPNECLVDFKVAFKFRSQTHAGIADMFFREVQERMLSAFEKRCDAVYGTSSSKAAHSTR